VSRRALGVAGVVALVAGAAVLAVLAVDVLRWRGQLEEADMRFAARSGTIGMWEPDAWLPGVTRSLLAVDDDLAFRRAVQRFRLSQPREPERTLRDAARRSQAESDLARIGRTDPSAEHRSLAATLRGALALEEARNAGPQTGLFLRRSYAGFRDAVRLDGSNEDAKFDLELVIELLKTLQDQSGAGAGGRRGSVQASGAGAASSGSGF
jgi:hypothetical protein